VLGRRRVPEIARGGARDGRIDGVRAAREIDGLESGERRDLIGGSGASIVGARLQLRVADAGLVAVGQHVIVAEHVNVARAVGYPRPDAAGGDGGMAYREAERSRSLPGRRIAE